MKIIPQQTIEDNGTNIDIFTYFRNYYSSSNLSGDGIVTIDASSTTWSTDYNKTGPTNIISAPDGLRWCSRYEKRVKLAIKFHSNSVTLFSYTIENFKGHRYIRSWDLYGISRGMKYLLDRRINETILGKAKDRTIFVPFKCQTIGSFHTFSFEMTGPDSNDDYYMSMSSIQFYGIVNPIHPLETCIRKRNNYPKLALFVQFLLTNL